MPPRMPKSRAGGEKVPGLESVASGGEITTPSPNASGVGPACRAGPRPTSRGGEQQQVRAEALQVRAVGVVLHRDAPACIADIGGETGRAISQRKAMAHG